MTDKSAFAAPRRVHFIGIGGAGMSAIAKVLIERGHAVSGSDLKRSPSVTILEAMGAAVEIGHRAELVDDADIVIVSSAIPEVNPELQRARALELETMARGAALTEILTGTRSIVIAGTHGKTTTTSMIVSVLLSAGLDPTYLVGGGLNDAGTNARSGSDDLAIAESDESDGSFLMLRPDLAVVTNVEADHLDHWGDIARIREAFDGFLERVKADGAIVVPADDEELSSVARRSGRRTIAFGDAGEVRAVRVAPVAGGVRFELVHGDHAHDVSLGVPGEHNVMNALAAAAACLWAGLSLDRVAEGLTAFRGVERRFQLRGSRAGVTIVDDYAHHPTEVKATLAAARPGPWERVVAVFQPHRYSRTAHLGAAFGAAFDRADRVVLTDVYGAGELPVPGVTGKLVADAVCRRLPGRPVAYLPHRGELVTYLARTSRPGDLVLTMGAGDITTVGDEVLARLGGEA